MDKKTPSGRKETIEIGVISDTHGPLEQRAAQALRGVQYIIHAGDIVDESVLFFLEQIAPVTAVRGNMDSYGVAGKLGKTALVEVGETALYVLHDLTQIDIDPKTAGIEVVVHGHTHRPEIRKKKGVLYLNPGSAGSPRYHHKPTVARLRLSGRSISARIIELP